MLLLPTGEVLYTDFGNVWVFEHVWEYQGAHGSRRFSRCPRPLRAGQTYVVSGLNFNWILARRCMYR